MPSAPSLSGPLGDLLSSAKGLPSAPQPTKPAPGGLSGPLGDLLSSAKGLNSPAPKAPAPTTKATPNPFTAPLFGGKPAVPSGNVQEPFQTPLTTPSMKQASAASLGNIGTALTTPAPTNREGIQGFAQSMSDSFNNAVDQFQNDAKQFAEPGVLPKVAATGDAVLQPLNVLFSSVTAAMNAAQGGIPAVAMLTDATGRVFNAIGAGGGDVAATFVDAMPISEKSKDTIRPLVRNLGALVAQGIAMGRDLGDATKLGKTKVTDVTGFDTAGPKIVDTTVKLVHAFNDAVQDPQTHKILEKQSNALQQPIKEANPTPFSKSSAIPEIKNKINSGKATDMHPTLRQELRDSLQNNGVAATHTALKDQLGAGDRQAAAHIREAPTPQNAAEELTAHQNALRTAVGDKYLSPDKMSVIKMGPKPKPTIDTIDAVTGKITKGTPPTVDTPTPRPTPAPKSDPLTTEGARNYIKKNYEEAKSNYQEAVKKYYEGNDNVISADVAKSVIPGYKGELAGIYHEASSDFAKKMYNEALPEKAGTKNNTVLFTGGATGVGKSTALRDAGTDIKDYPIVYDTNLNGSGAITKIQAALDHGYKVEIKFTHRDPLESFTKGVIPRVMKEDRIVTASEHIARHEQVPASIQAIEDHFGGHIENGNLIIEHIDNTGPKGTAKSIPFDKIPKFDYNNLHEQITEATREAVRSGEITEAHGAAITVPKDDAKASGGAEPKSTTGEPGQVLKPVESAGPTEKSTLAAKVDANTVEKKLADTLGDTPQYNKTNWKDQASKAVDLLNNDPDRAIRIATGQEAPPSDVLAGSVFTAVEEHATQTGDVETLRQLAQGAASGQFTRFGQEIGSLSQRSQDGAVAKISEVQKARETAFQKTSGKSPAKALDEDVQALKQVRKSSAPKAKDWNSFIKSLQC